MLWYCWFWLWVVASGVLLYHRASMTIWSLSSVIILGLATGFGHSSWYALGFCWLLLAGTVLIFNVPAIRRRLITQRIFALYRKLMPSMSNTEKEALAAGTVGWEAELFSGAPRWHKLFAFKQPQLSEEEKAFY